MILQACVFEIVTHAGRAGSRAGVGVYCAWPAGRETEFPLCRHDLSRRAAAAMGRNGSVPDVSRPETKLWFYYQAASYIDLGFEAIHFGQVEIMNRNDRDLAHWSQVLTLVRAYAAKHARRHMVLCDGHVPSGGLVRDGKLLLDFHSFPLRIMEVPDKPQEAILKVGFSDGIYGRSKGGVTFSGWKCDHLPYLVEIDNWGVEPAAGQSQGRRHLDLGLRRNHLVCRAERTVSQRLAPLRLGLGAEDRPERPFRKCRAAARCVRPWTASDGIMRTIPARRRRRDLARRRRFGKYGRADRPK